MPSEYKPYTQKGVKKFASNEAFINNKELKREYENRCYNSTVQLPTASSSRPLISDISETPF